MQRAALRGLSSLAARRAGGVRRAWTLSGVRGRVGGLSRSGGVDTRVGVRRASSAWLGQARGAWRLAAGRRVDAWTRSFSSADGKDKDVEDDDEGGAVQDGQSGLSADDREVAEAVIANMPPKERDALLASIRGEDGESDPVALSMLAAAARKEMERVESEAGAGAGVGGVSDGAEAADALKGVVSDAQLDEIADLDVGGEGMSKEELKAMLEKQLDEDEDSDLEFDSEEDMAALFEHESGSEDEDVTDVDEDDDDLFDDADDDMFGSDLEGAFDQFEGEDLAAVIDYVQKSGDPQMQALLENLKTHLDTELTPNRATDSGVSVPEALVEKNVPHKYLVPPEMEKYAHANRLAHLQEYLADREIEDKKHAGRQLSELPELDLSKVSEEDLDEAHLLGKLALEHVQNTPTWTHEQRVTFMKMTQRFIDNVGSEDPEDMKAYFELQQGLTGLDEPDDSDYESDEDLHFG